MLQPICYCYKKSSIEISERIFFSVGSTSDFSDILIFWLSIEVRILLQFGVRRKLTTFALRQIPGAVTGDVYSCYFSFVDFSLSLFLL